MKILFSVLSVLLVLGTSSAHAADQKLTCVFGLDESGSATVEVRKVVDHPENLLLVVSIQKGGIHVEGLLAAQYGHGNMIWGSGVVFNANDALTIINPETISIQGTLKADGLHASLMDDDRILQHGFGAPLDCK